MSEAMFLPHLIGSLSLGCVFLLICSFVAVTRKRIRRTLRSLAAVSLLYAAALIAAAVSPGTVPVLIPYENLGTFETSDLQGRTCRIEVQAKALSHVRPPGTLPRLRLVSHGPEGQDSLTYDTGWRFDVGPIRPVPGGLEVFHSYPHGGGVRFSVSKSKLNVEKEGILGTAPHDLPGLEGTVDRQTYEVLKLIGNVSGLHGGWFNPAALVRAVNALRQMGREKAAEIIRVYYRHISGHGISVFNEEEVDKLLLIQRLLFVPKESSGRFPSISVGLEELNGSLDEEFPLLPLVVFKGVPFVLAPHQGRYAHHIAVEDPTQQLDIYLERFDFLPAPLVPSDDPLAAFQELRSSRLWYWLQEYDGSHFYLREGGFRVQALMAMSVMDPTTAQEYNSLTSGDQRAADQVWDDRTKRIRLLKPRWDGEHQEYIRTEK